MAASAYDAIALNYHKTRSPSDAKDRFELENVRHVFRPLVTNGARVLELACGSGFYSFHLLDWGASFVTGVDISPQMLDIANKVLELDPDLKNKTCFIEADCGSPVDLTAGKGLFDVVFAAWLLPYAPDARSLTQMMTTVSLNLKAGGVFVTVTTPVSDDPEAEFVHETRARPPIPGQFYRQILHRVPDGVCQRAFLPSFDGKGKSGDSNYFDAYRLSRQTYEKSARDAGLTGDIQWMQPSLSAITPGAGMSLSDHFVEVPEFSLLIVKK